MKRIAVYCGSNFGARPEYESVATEVGAHLAQKGLGVVFGGGSVGLMGVVARAALDAGGEVIGVMPEMFKELEDDSLELTEMHIVDSMHTRKAMMADLADGFIALPGGLGTMDEIFEIATWGQLEIHNKPAGFLNTAGYYNGLKSFLDHMVTEGFVKAEHRNMVMVEANIADLIDRFENYQPPQVSKLIGQ
ncbi:MAG: TIGR00730 family Rossman fold protein [Chloroflexi bacterium]|nr:MAG: TIGR00730 family Rossman fold protein [Chloroflexota bacterium]MBL1194383.1 TIGR00730 family Rossman fold protein [Chloroflexota bacterium]NOH11671.1 TIGR00730 family Rossman fold protein [Chloroflexota bacterium]